MTGLTVEGLTSLNSLSSLSRTVQLTNYRFSSLQSTFTFQGSRLAYQQFGKGPRVLLAFHGMGQRSNCFAPLERVLHDSFTIYSFDLFYHGASSCLFGDEYTEGEVLTKAYWQELITAFAIQQRIDSFSVAGFSLGGRFALTTTELFADRIDELWLFSPDGITISPWYWIAIHTRVGRWLFPYFLTHLASLHRAGLLLTKLGLLDRSLLRFAESTLSTPVQRQRVYRSWLSFRNMQVNLKRFGEQINKANVGVRFFMGYFDRVLPPSAMRPLTRHLQAYTIRVIKAGHNRLVERIAESWGE